MGKTDRWMKMAFSSGLPWTWSSPPLLFFFFLNRSTTSLYVGSSTVTSSNSDAVCVRIVRRGRQGVRAMSGGWVMAAQQWMSRR
jgi:hypothetical protein